MSASLEAQSGYYPQLNCTILSGLSADYQAKSTIFSIN
ncbi:hypothetical protein Y11_21141 [Yersinia enterocolitica subsp. palearctica Y11]|uniref:Uncharacterized protein n=2 Tax=Yersinia enterocolitica TaxID=630 RepID=A0A0H3NRX8_YERE1|nr:unknown protein [Yersinia enterocolitica W22703]CBY26067.1 hypothetical protein Y11_21141 [Yersinia enterocolitica subsp. palearctica Y11]CCO69717.1 hypothetical protein D322_2843 [Yersinia enterocolitica IP 10393]